MKPEYNIDLDYKIYQFYPKYTTLQIASNVAFSNTNATNLDIYIDASNFIESMLKPNVNVSNSTGIVSGLINLAIHLRKFYSKYYNVSTKIYIVYSDRTDNFGVLLPGYNESIINLYKSADDIKKNIIDTNIGLLIELCKYLEDIYFITTHIEPATKIQSLINIYSKNIPVAIFSKDAFMCQLAAINNNVVLFRTLKNNMIEESITLIGYGSAIGGYFKLNKKSSITEDIAIKFNPMLLSTLITLTECKERNILKLFSLKKAISILSEALDNYKLLNVYPDLNYLYDSLNIQSYIDKNDFNMRFKAIDILNQLTIYDMKYPESQDTSWYINNINAAAVKEINDKYFIKNPINLENLQ